MREKFRATRIDGLVSRSITVSLRDFWIGAKARMSPTFFAFAGLDANALNEDHEGYVKHVAVWCIDRRQANVWNAEAGVEIIHVQSYGNERMRNQLGWFTLLKAPYDSLEEYVSHFAKAPKALRRALADLELMGVNFSSIYPGVYGSARTAVLREVGARIGRP